MLSVIKSWSFKWTCNNRLTIIRRQTLCNPCGNGLALSSQCSTNSIYGEHKRRKSSSTGGTMVLGWLLWEDMMISVGWWRGWPACLSHVGKSLNYSDSEASSQLRLAILHYVRTEGAMMGEIELKVGCLDGLSS